jgi:LAO/AO transport system kinase
LRAPRTLPSWYEAPGLGDEVQAIKAGVLEIADVFAVNKADREGADHTVMALHMMQGLAQRPAAHHRPAGPIGHTEPGLQDDGSWLPPVSKTVATRGEGVEALRDWIERHATYLHETGQIRRREVARASIALDHILRDALITRLLAKYPQGHLATLAERVASRKIDPYTAASQLLNS